MAKTYRVLLVDDEPLTLAGIKIMLDWEANGCVLLPDARNGKQALERLKDGHADIVVADINMPVMDGIDLLKAAAEMCPQCVFIMLTNLEEFELARQSLQYKAVDYLVKNQLEPDMLLKSLDKAKHEVDKRRKLGRVEVGAKARDSGREQALRNSVLHLMVAPVAPAEVVEEMMAAGVLESFMMLGVQLRYPEHILHAQGAQEECARLYHWEKEVLEEVARNCFTQHVVVDLDSQRRNLVVLIWGAVAQELETQMQSFHKKLVTASGKITGVKPCLLVCGPFWGSDKLGECRRQMFEMRNYFYNSEAEFFRYKDIPPMEYASLALTGIAGRMKTEIRSKNVNGCRNLFDRAIARVRQVDHEESQALWLCTELYSAVCEVLEKWPDSKSREGRFFAPAEGYAQLHLLATKKHVLQALEEMKNEVMDILQPVGAHYTDIVEQAKRYVNENIDKKIMLQDVARKVCISPGYLSALFKKHCGENFVDYINRTKMERACELIKQDEYRMSQIGYMLSYENAYYFTRVFKRYIGMPPSEYQQQLRKSLREGMDVAEEP